MLAYHLVIKLNFKVAPNTIMQNVPSNLELLLLHTKIPIPKKNYDRIQSILAMYGYTTLYLMEKSDPETIIIPSFEDYPYQLQIITQNLHANISESYGVIFNQNIVKAVKGLKRKLHELDLRIAFPQSLEDHTAQIANLNIAEINSIHEFAAKNSSEFHPPFPIISTISNSNSRTRVDKIKYKNELAVCKTFRASNLEGLERELASRKALGDKIPEISKVLDSGENYFVMPLYESTWSWQEGSLGLFPLGYAEKCIDVIKRINDEQWSLLDWHPGNFIYGRNNHVILIDLEASRKEPSVSAFTECPDIVGHKNFQYQGKPINYPNTWQPIIGLPLNVLLHGSSLNKSLRRTVYLLVKTLPKWSAKKIEQKLRLVYRKLFNRRELSKHGSYFLYRF